MLERFIRWWKSHSLVAQRLEKIGHQMDLSSDEISKIKHNHIDPLYRLIKEMREEPAGFEKRKTDR